MQNVFRRNHKNDNKKNNNMKETNASKQQPSEVIVMSDFVRVRTCVWFWKHVYLQLVIQYTVRGFVSTSLPILRIVKKDGKTVQWERPCSILNTLPPKREDHVDALELVVLDDVHYDLLAFHMDDRDRLVKWFMKLTEATREEGEFTKKQILVKAQPTQKKNEQETLPLMNISTSSPSAAPQPVVNPVHEQAVRKQWQEGYDTVMEELKEWVVACPTGFLGYVDPQEEAKPLAMVPEQEQQHEKQDPLQKVMEKDVMKYFVKTSRDLEFEYVGQGTVDENPEDDNHQEEEEEEEEEDVGDVDDQVFDSYDAVLTQLQKTLTPQHYEDDDDAIEAVFYRYWASIDHTAQYVLHPREVEF